VPTIRIGAALERAWNRMAKRARNPDKVAAKDPLLEAIGSRILDARRELRLSQDQLAEKAGMTHSSVYQAENGLQNLTVLSLKKLADALEVGLKALLPDEDVVTDPDPVSRIARELTTELGRAVMLTKRLEGVAATLEALNPGGNTPTQG
jgi:transcriptional regulator with XRE-family HTH domain